MRHALMIFPAALLYVLPAAAYPDSATPNLAKIDRAIGKEPAYKAAPRYALLALGEKADSRVWLVLDGDTLYADWDRTGDLTQPYKRFAGKPDAGAASRNRSLRSFWEYRMPGASFRGPGGQLYTPIVVRRVFKKDFVPATEYYRDLKRRVAEDPEHAQGQVHVHFNGFAKMGLPQPVQMVMTADFAKAPRDAPVFHLDGQLKFWTTPEDEPQFVLGRVNKVRFSLGIPITGAGATCYRAHADAPDESNPVMRVEFPAKPGEKGPVCQEVELRDRSCWCYFEADVRVPAGAGIGKAKLTLSYPGWKGAVRPTTFEWRVVEKPAETAK